MSCIKCVFMNTHKYTRKQTHTHKLNIIQRYFKLIEGKKQKENVEKMLLFFPKVYSIAKFLKLVYRVLYILNDDE